MSKPTWSQWFYPIAEKLAAEVAAKLLYLLLVAAVTALLWLAATYLWPSSPDFLHKTWQSDDGAVVMRGETLSAIEIVTRGGVALELNVTEETTNPSRYSGELKCVVHGGTIGQLELELEPHGQIRARTVWTTSQDYELDERLRVNWPDAPQVTTGKT
ncbi:MAG: hypothetical protein NXI04_17520 [Planctomycetaceae bacterium]|nr:hypothetical protein [Planctomycetaceae bacterium]